MESECLARCTMRPLSGGVRHSPATLRVSTELNRPSRHPILEGKVACSDCHNVHGSVGPKLVKKDSTVETCYQCHAEKRGPFVHNHEPVQEDCGNCHNPHGTVADSLLKMRQPFLCHA